MTDETGEHHPGLPPSSRPRPPSVTTKQVAAHAGVSAGTVSNVLNNPALVAAATRERVERAIAELGFVPNESAGQLRRGTSRTIALVVPDLANPFFDDVAAGADAAADEAGAMVLVSSSANSAAHELRHLRLLSRQRLLGLLITPMDEPPWEVLDEISRQGTPVVLIDHTPVSRPDAVVVTVDDEEGGRLVGQHLIAAGHRSIVFLAPVFQQTQARLAGLRSAVGAQAHVEVLRCQDMTVASGFTSAAEVLDRPAASRPTAVFCGNDLIALGVLNQCARRGVQVPGQLSVIGYDDIGLASTANVPLSTVRQPREDLGRQAVGLVLQQAQEQALAVLRPDLMLRESSGRRRD